ncbi:MAG TPA: hypothetical protein VGV68_01825 [Terriglobia bacterium]|nr:hypothetical protein [Terriglobia bacterium]
MKALTGAQIQTHAGKARFNHHLCHWRHAGETQVLVLRRRMFGLAALPVNVNKPSGRGLISADRPRSLRE